MESELYTDAQCNVDMVGEARRITSSDEDERKNCKRRLNVDKNNSNKKLNTSSKINLIKIKMPMGNGHIAKKLKNLQLAACKELKEKKLEDIESEDIESAARKESEDMELIAHKESEDIESSSLKESVDIELADKKNNAKNKTVCEFIRNMRDSHLSKSEIKKRPTRVYRYDYEALREPLDAGWRRLIVKRANQSSSNKRTDTYYYTPCGKKLRSCKDVEKFLDMNPSPFTTKNFSFGQIVIGVGEPYEIERDALVGSKGEKVTSPSSPKKKKRAAESEMVSLEEGGETSTFKKISTKRPRRRTKVSKAEKFVRCEGLLDDNPHMEMQSEPSLPEVLEKNLLASSDILSPKSRGKRPDLVETSSLTLSFPFGSGEEEMEKLPPCKRSTSSDSNVDGGKKKPAFPVFQINFEDLDDSDEELEKRVEQEKKTNESPKLRVRSLEELCERNTVPEMLNSISKPSVTFANFNFNANVYSNTKSIPCINKSVSITQHSNVLSSAGKVLPKRRNSIPVDVDYFNITQSNLIRTKLGLSPTYKIQPVINTPFLNGVPHCTLPSNSATSFLNACNEEEISVFAKPILSTVNTQHNFIYVCNNKDGCEDNSKSSFVPRYALPAENHPVKLSQTQEEEWSSFDDEEINNRNSPVKAIRKRLVEIPSSRAEPDYFAYHKDIQQYCK